MEHARRCMSDRIRSTLAERIYSGSLRPGERLVELEIAREFDTSQTPVREAFRELEVLRLVESQPYRGTRVREVSPREMAEAYLVRGVLEQLAAELAGPHLQAALGPLEAALEGIRSGAYAGDSERYAAQNLAFHRYIVEAADNRILLQAWEALSFETRMRLSVSRSSPADLIERIQIHVDIVDAFRSGDFVTAGHLLRNHSHGLTELWRDKPPSSESAEPVRLHSSHGSDESTDTKSPSLREPRTA